MNLCSVKESECDETALFISIQIFGISHIFTIYIHTYIHTYMYFTVKKEFGLILVCKKVLPFPAGQRSPEGTLCVSVCVGGA